MTRTRAIVTAFVASAFLAPAANAAVYQFFDTTFVPSDWLDTKWSDTTPGALATYTAVQVNVGGSPNPPGTPDFRETTHTYNNGAIKVAHFNTLFNWSPGPGEVAVAVDYEYDLSYSAGPPGAVGYQPMIEQGGNIYVTPFDNIFQRDWLTFGSIGLPLTAFDQVAPGSGLVLTGVNPAGNLAMSFGYVSANSANGLTTKVSGIDNYNVHLHTVPEPSTAAIGLGVMGLVGLRRRARSVASV